MLHIILSMNYDNACLVNRSKQVQLHSDFAEHISELDNPIDRPYSQPIDKDLLTQEEDIEHLNKEIHNIIAIFIESFIEYSTISLLLINTFSLFLSKISI